MKTFTLMIVAFTTTILLATQVLQMTNNHASATTSPTIVQAGEATTPLAVFSPQTVEINAGESVTWTNPTKKKKACGVRKFSSLHFLLPISMMLISASYTTTSNANVQLRNFHSRLARP